LGERRVPRRTMGRRRHQGRHSSPTPTKTLGVGELLLVGSGGHPPSSIGPVLRNPGRLGGGLIELRGPCSRNNGRS
jgi:hypothetical protein